MLFRLSIGLVMVFAAAAQQRPADQPASFYSPAKEAALGASLARNLRGSSPAIESPAAQNYVDRLGRLLAARLPAGGPAYTFEILERAGNSLQQPAVLPGGYIFVPVGLFEAAQNEAEFAGVLAHAMAHAAERHSTSSFQRGELIRVASIPLIFLGGWSGIDGRGELPVAFAVRGRALEIDADRIAVRSMAQAGYDPAAFLRYIERMQTEGGAMPGSPLPQREMRLNELAQTIAALPPLSFSSDDAEFERVREELRSLSLGVNPPRIRN